MLAVVAGAIANTAGKGGDTWHRLHWVLGLRRLGLTVHFVEQIDRAYCLEPSPQLAYFRSVLADFDLNASSTLLTNDGDRVFGLSQADLRRLIDDADLFINISGHLEWRRLGARPQRAVFIDEDPGFTQMWLASALLGHELHGYDAYYSVGYNIGQPHCGIPTHGIQWRPLRPFAVLSEWPNVTPRVFDRFTTVGGWRGPFGVVEFEGRKYGQKAHEFRKFAAVPRLTEQSFELALDIHADDHADIAMLRSSGWQLIDPQHVAAGPHAFRTYVQSSGAEFSVAKGMYVDTNSGWFSDRTIRYLASGRPAVVQDTGWSAHYAAKRGLLAFRTVDEAVAACQRIEREYEEHCEAARELASEYFDSDHVLGRVLDEVGAGALS